jgi:lysophospholipase L1-like esterase
VITRRAFQFRMSLSHLFWDLSGQTMCIHRSMFIVAVTISWVIHGSNAAAKPHHPCLRDGDRVILLGDTFIEREGDRGFIEAALVATHPDAALTIRNLGWSGDTVWAESRGVFDPPAKGYARMLDLVRDLAPTVIFIAYGRNESFRGADGLAAFRDQLRTLCDDLQTATRKEIAEDVRLVLVTPHPFEGADAVHRNAALAPYAEVIRETATAREAGLVDLFADLAAALPRDCPATENGVHLSDSGYAAAAQVFAQTCGPREPDDLGDLAAKLAAIRPLIIEKNRLFFHRWRPANETYIFLFRKHEQGNNAVEIPQFDPLVEAAEAKVRAAARRLH